MRSSASSKSNALERPGTRGRRDGHAAAPGQDAASHGPAVAQSSLEPLLAIVYRCPDGCICHSRCGRSLQLQGCRGGLELDFYCQRCVEHVTLPECILARIPCTAGRAAPAAPNDAGQRGTSGSCRMEML
jgi:hypothetical protein